MHGCDVFVVFDFYYYIMCHHHVICMRIAAMFTLIIKYACIFLTANVDCSILLKIMHLEIIINHKFVSKGIKI